jgi:hypothetical protein
VWGFLFARYHCETVHNAFLLRYPVSDQKSYMDESAYIRVAVAQSIFLLAVRGYNGRKPTLGKFATCNSLCRWIGKRHLSTDNYGNHTRQSKYQS